MFKSTKGITLVTLVITIIVLTILAGIVVASLTSEDKNIVRRSQESKEDLETDQEKEILESILVEVDNKFFENNEAGNNAKIAYITDALTLEGVKDFEVFIDYVTIKDRIYYFTDIMPDFGK